MGLRSHLCPAVLVTSGWSGWLVRRTGATSAEMLYSAPMNARSPDTQDAADPAALAVDSAGREALHGAAVALCSENRLPEVLLLLEAAVVRHPDDPQLWNDLGVARWVAHNPAAARPALETAVRLDPRNGCLASNLGACLLACCDFPPAARALRRAFALTANPALHLPLATALVESWKLPAARRHFRAALENPADRATAWAGLAEVDLFAGRSERAARVLRRSLAESPDAARHSALLRLLHYLPRAGRDSLFREHSLWAVRYCPGGERPPHRRPRRSRLRVAYLSGKFVAHTAQLGPMLRHYDPARFDVVALTDGPGLTQSACRWIDTSRLSNQQVAALVRELKIDILVECDGHFCHGARLPLFALCPAPVQIALPFYPGSAAVPAVALRVTDSIVDPNVSEAFFTESLVRLPLYLPWEPTPLPPPAKRRPRDPILFGSFNALPKLNAGVIDCWAALLSRFARSRLLLQYYFDRPGSPAVNPAVRRRLHAAFDRRGVDPSRVQLQGALSHREQMALHSTVDVALDPFPYNGTLTTLNALSMGVPIVTLTGNTSAARVGTSILASVGLDTLIAGDVDDYCRIAADLAGDASRRTRCGRRIRDAFQSPLWSPATYVRELEAVYLQACERNNS